MASKFDNLDRLAKLLDEGKITQAEFDAMKADLFGQDSTQRDPMTGKPAGWYNDPSGKHQHQVYWDGSNWTGQTRSQWSETSPIAPKRPVWKRWWFWAVVIVVAAIVGNTDGDPADTVDPTASPSTTMESENATITTAAPASTVPLASTAVSVELPAYSIVEEEDVSFAGVVRISLRVTVEQGTTSDQLRTLALALAEQYRESDEYQAFNIFFYHFPELANDFATLGIWDDSPYGEWGRAGDVDRGDYSKHEPNDQIMEKDWTLLPNQEQVDLYIAYGVKFDQMDTDPNELPSDDDVFAAVSKDSGVSVEAIEDAIGVVLTWMFNNESS